MTTNYTSKKLSFNNAEQFKESFSEPEPATVGYVFIGNHIPYANESSPDSIVDSTFDAKSVWDNMFAAKRVTGNDVELVAPRVNWTANTKYKQFDDKITLGELLTGNTTLNVKSMYVITTARNVYKCLSNNASANSTVEPTGDFVTSNGTISMADGFVWKYLFNVKPSNRFLTNDWIPAPISTTKLDYGVSSTSPIDGELTTIIVVNGGTGYQNPTINTTAFNAGVSSITLANTTNVAANMTVTGTGIHTGSYVSSVNTITNIVTLSTPTSAAGGGSGNTTTYTTRIFIEGDGLAAAASANIVNSSISKITVSVFGTDFTFANASVFGSGTGATTRCIIPPKWGHSFNPAKEISASNVMINERIGSVNSTEQGLISINTSIRQYGLLRDPYKYNSITPLISSNANSVISQTTNLTLVAGVNFTLDEFVFQGTSSNTATFYGRVNDQSANEVRLSRVRGESVVGGTLIGVTSGVIRTVVKEAKPELQPYTGDIMYVENVTKIERADGQSENIKFVIKF